MLPVEGAEQSRKTRTKDRTSIVLSLCPSERDRGIRGSASSHCRAVSSLPPAPFTLATHTDSHANFCCWVCSTLSLSPLLCLRSSQKHFCA